MTTIKAKGIKVTTGIKGGSLCPNHNVRATAIRVQTGLRAGHGMFSRNHNRAVLTKRR